MTQDFILNVKFELILNKMFDKIFGPEKIMYNGFELEPSRVDCFYVIVSMISVNILFFGTIITIT